MNLSIFPFIILGFHGAWMLAAVIALAWLFFRRLRIRDEETFEKRDN